VPPYDVVIGLGANLGNRAETLEAASRALGRLGELISLSGLYETAAVGPAQPDFLNGAARLLYAAEPMELMTELLALERVAGRERRERWGPRTLDLDVLWIRGVVLQSPALTVPHPELSVRPFALVPLLDVAPDATDPSSGIAYSDILAKLDRSSVRCVSADWSLAVRPPRPPS